MADQGVYEVDEIAISRDVNETLRGRVTSTCVHGPLVFLGSSTGDVAVCAIVDCNFISRRNEILGVPDVGDTGGISDSQLALHQVLVLPDFGSNAKPRPNTDPAAPAQTIVKPEGFISQIIVVPEWDMVFVLRGGSVLVCNLQLSIDEDLEELFVAEGLVGGRQAPDLGPDGQGGALHDLLRREALGNLDPSIQYCVGGMPLA